MCTNQITKVELKVQQLEKNNIGLANNIPILQVKISGLEHAFDSDRESIGSLNNDLYNFISCVWFQS